MAKFLDRLTFEIEYPLGTWSAITPDVEDVLLSKKREDGQYFYRLTLDSEVTFRKAAWAFISDIEENDHCAEVNLRITCGTDIVYEGALSLNDGDFDFSNCAAVLKSATNDDYTCLEQGLKKEINILGDSNDETLNFTIGSIVTTSCPVTGTTLISGLYPVNPPVQDSCLTFPDTWAVKENHFTFITPSGSGAFPPFTAEHRTVWVRQVVTSATQPPGIGWVDIGGGQWARKPTTEWDQENSTSQPPEESEWHQYYNLSYGDLDSIDNGRLLSDMLDFMLGQIGCSLPVVSDFFMINPDFTAPSNDVYMAAQEKLARLLFFQKSDVKRADVSDNATEGIMTLDELFSWMANRLQVFPSLETGSLRLEHITYYQDKPISLDLTDSAYIRWVKGARRYSYAGTNPRYLKFPQYEGQGRLFFDGLQIEYGAACSSKDGGDAPYPSGRFVTDLALVINSSGNFSDDGFVVVNAIEFSGALYADMEVSALNSTAELLNGHLSMPNLHDKYWRDYAYQASGLLNGVTIDFDSVRPSKRGVPITIPGWCCADFLNFDPASLVRTPIGDGEIEKITYSVKTGNVVFELIYPTTTTS